MNIVIKIAVFLITAAVAFTLVDRFISNKEKSECQGWAQESGPFEQWQRDQCARFQINLK